MTHMTKRDAVAAAMSIAEDVTEGKLAPAALEAQLVAECRALVGPVVGEGDPLFPLQLEVCRSVLAAGGLSSAEISEWLAVARRRETPADPGSSGSGPLGSNTGIS
jgi:hypothetical protein